MKKNYSKYLLELFFSIARQNVRRCLRLHESESTVNCSKMFGGGNNNYPPKIPSKSPHSSKVHPQLKESLAMESEVSNLVGRSVLMISCLNPVPPGFTA
jgi:hypothetical protein